MRSLIQAGYICFALAILPTAGAQPIGKALPQMLSPFPLEDVKLLQGPLKEALDNDRHYLLSLDVNRLLHNFRKNAGLPSKAAPLGGWEAPDCELRGHFTGHFMSACALAYAATHDETLKERAGRVVDGLAQCQKALGPSGYLSAFPEEFIDRVETGKKVWAPWYTLHKIGAGLLDVYHYCGNTRSLEALTRMMAWVKTRTDRLDDSQMQAMLKVEQGGMCELLRNLYAISRNPDHLLLAGRFDHRAFLGPLAEGKDSLSGLHANTNIPKIIGAARSYELTGDAAAYTATMFFWNQIVHARSFATGGTSNYEYWLGPPAQMSGQLSAETHENCCTYNMLKLTDHVFCWTRDVGAADYYERALFNGILPTQKPGSGAGLMYYVPMHSGLFKLFGDPDSAYWCCTGTGMESFAKPAQGIYYHDSAGIYINLYVASEVRWNEQALVVRQETRFPDEEGSTITIKTSGRGPVSLHLRIPYWLAPQKAVVTLNGATCEERPGPQGYVTITRKWNKDDRVEIRLPMHLHLEHLPGDRTVAAIMYGPLVMAGELGTEEMTESMREGFSTPEVDRMLFDGPAQPAPRMVIPAEDVTTWVQPVPGKPLTFRTVNVGKPRDVTLIPFYRLFGERYAIYWELMGKIDWKIFEQQRNPLPPGVVDSVTAGDQRSNWLHNFQAFRYDTGSVGGRPWVQSSEWLRYDMNVLPSTPQILTCQVLSDTLDRSFDLFYDGSLVRSDTLKGSPAAEFREVSYRIPRETVNGGSRIAIKFMGRENRPTPKVCGCSIRAPRSD